MKLFLTLFFFSASVCAQMAPNSYVPATRILRAKGYQIGVYADTFTTNKFVDEDGKKVDLPEGTSFNRFQTEVAGYYGATNELQFGIGFRFRRNMAKAEENGEEVVATGTGLQSTFINFMYAFAPVNRIQYTLEGTFRYTPYSNDILAEADRKTLILGDVGNEMSGGVGATYFSPTNNFFTLRGGYRRPGTDLSHELYWQAEAAMAWKYVALVAGVDGITSMKNDPYEDTPEERPVYNSGTMLYGSNNREMIAPYAGINFALGDTWRIELRGSQVVSGRSTDLGSAFGINLIKRSDTAATRLVDSKFKTYDLEASVTKVSPKKEYVVIDKGLSSDVRKGMRIDLFEFDYVGGNVLVASGVVLKIKSDSAIVKITQRYNSKKEIKEGLVARATLK